MTRSRLLASLLSLSLAAPLAAATLPAGNPADKEGLRTYTFQFTPKKAQRSLEDFLKFLKRHAPGKEGIHAQYLVADLYMEKGDYKRAAEIFQIIAAVPLDDEFFNISILQKLADCYFQLGFYKQAFEAYSIVGKSTLSALIPEALLGMTVSDLAQNNREEALTRMQELTAFYPAYETDPDVMLPLGLVLWENKKFDEALAYFLRNPDDPACLYFAGLCQREIKKPVEALSTFKKIVQGHPKTVWGERARFELGETFYQEKDLNLSGETFDGILRDKPAPSWHTLASYRLACTDFRRNRFKETEKRLRSLRRVNRNHALAPSFTYVLSESLAEQKKLHPLVKLLHAEIRSKRKTPDTLFRYTWALTAVEEYKEAVRQTNELLKNSWDPELTPKTLLIQGYAYQKMNQYPEAVSSYQLVVDNFPKSIYAAKALQLTAIAYFRSRQYIPVVTQVNHQWETLAPEIRKKHPDVLYWIAESHLNLENGKEARSFYQKFLDLAKPTDPLVSQALIGQAVSYAVDKDFNTAIVTLQRTYQAAQEKADAVAMGDIMVEMGNVYFNSRDYENAAASYRSFQQIAPQHVKVPFALYQEGLSLYRAEYYTDAVAAWQKLVKEHRKDPKSPETLLKIAKTQFDLGQSTEAIRSYQTILDDYSKSGNVKEARLQIGQVYYNTANYALAIKHFTDFLSRYPNDPETPNVLSLLQTCYYRANKTPEEIQKLTQKQPKSAILADIYWEEGAKAYNNKDYVRARSYFDKIMFEFPSSSLAPQAAFYRAESFYQQEKFVEATPAYMNFIQYFPTDSQVGVAKFHLSVSYFNQNEFLKSAEAFDDFVTAFPDDPMAKNAALNVALCYTKIQETDKAIDAYRYYIQNYADAAEVGGIYLQMGALFEKVGQDDKAIHVYREVTSNLTEYPEALFGVARCFRKLNRLDEERAAYEQFRDVQPKNNPYRLGGLLQLAEIYIIENKLDAARATYQDVLKSNPDEQSAATAQQRLQLLQGGNP
ncbi:MAG TPA: tetratricopeptide repeat protein [Elusimicrobiota bacterium]|nr:tetratricopeptide repeat protein [Elusimicrobiota bacterium]